MQGAPPAQPWYHGIEPSAWRSLFAAGAGWMLDGMDVMLFAMAMPQIKAEFALTPGQTGAVAAITYLFAAVGGGLAGMVADRFGRVRMLMLSILIYSVFTALCATSQSVWQLLLWRALVGFGMGGEWSAGAVLVAETWPAKHRGKAIGLMQSGFAIGYIFAALLAAAILPTGPGAWRWLFVAGITPAFLTLWIRKALPEPAIWTGGQEGHRASTLGFTQVLPVLARPPYRRHALIATSCCTVLLFAYWGLFTWMPSYLKESIKLTTFESTLFIVTTQLGAFFGYASFGFIADKLGRRPTFLAYVLGAAAVVPIYGYSGSKAVLLIVGPFLGFFGHGYFSVFGSMLAELFPTSIRATAQGLCYNAGRAVSAAAPVIIGWLSTTLGLGPTLGLTSMLYIVGASLVLMLPETKGKEIE